MSSKITSFSGEFAFLSNFHPIKVRFEGLNFPTVEHAFVAAKTTDMALRREITLLATPGKAKRAGRKLELRPEWETMKVAVMRSLLFEKFSNFEMTRALLATEFAELIEGNTWGDTFWGVSEGEGLNMLGLLLMEVRATLFVAREMTL